MKHNLIKRHTTKQIKLLHPYILKDTIQMSGLRKQYLNQKSISQ